MMRHPCFNAGASRKWGRVHLPVAPGCNITCGYCDRRTDCVNESRPGVTSRVMSPEEAVDYLGRVLAAMPNISVAGIAGPGDPLAAPDLTLETIRLVRNRFPGLALCLSTNGLGLPERILELRALGVGYLTLTINTVDPAVGGQIYRSVNYGGRSWNGAEGAGILLHRQRQALEALGDQGFVVKINTVIIPGCNDRQVGPIARLAASHGAHLMNCLPLIPVPGTPLGHLNSPDGPMMVTVRNQAGQYLKQMRHCGRCRADAVGLICPTEEAAAAETLRMPLDIGAESIPLPEH